MSNKKKIKAASISYSKDKLNIPEIGAIGEGALAEKIIELAKANQIKIVENEHFFEFDDLFKIGQQIPHDVYTIVAKILAAILKTNREQSDGEKDLNK